MKKLEMIIQSDKLDVIRRILEESDVTEYYMTDVMKNSTHESIVKKYRGAEYQVTQIPQVKIEAVVTDAKIEILVSRIVKESSTKSSAQMVADNVVNGKIFIYDVQDAIKIQTGERGESALS